MELKLEIPDGTIVDALKELIVNRQVIRDAMTKAISQSKLVDGLAVLLTEKINGQVTAAIESDEVSSAIRESITAAMGSLVQSRVSKEVSKEVQNNTAHLRKVR